MWPDIFVNNMQRYMCSPKSLHICIFRYVCGSTSKVILRFGLLTKRQRIPESCRKLQEKPKWIFRTTQTHRKPQRVPHTVTPDTYNELDRATDGHRTAHFLVESPSKRQRKSGEHQKAPQLFREPQRQSEPQTASKALRAPEGKRTRQSPRQHQRDTNSPG